MLPTATAAHGAPAGSLDRYRINLERDEIESFCAVISLKTEDTLPALRNLKSFLNTDEYLRFERLKGSDCNAPILAFKPLVGRKVPIGVFKYEPDSSFAEKRMRALDEMKNQGCAYLPNILKNRYGDYLVTLGASSYSCIEYIEPDSDQLSSIEQMFALASKFHAYSKTSSMTEELRKHAIDDYSDSHISQLDPALIQWDRSIFETADWSVCVKCAHYFTTKPFMESYRKLPTQLIHGDISPNNIIISNIKHFIIDLDKVKTDVRLLDFVTFCGWNFLEEYLTLTEENNLFSHVQTYYGDLEEVEKEHFHHIILLGRCGVLSWSLQVLKQSLEDRDLQTQQRFRDILMGTIRQINQIYKRVPHMAGIVDNS